MFFQVVKKEINTDRIKTWVIFFLLFSWILIFLNVRFSSEGWATSFFLLAYALYFFKNSGEINKYFFVGLLLGFAFLSRYQIGLLIFGFGLWVLFHGNEKYSRLCILILGLIFSILIGFLIDYWFYEKLVFSFWNYFECI